MDSIWLEALTTLVGVNNPILSKNKIKYYFRLYLIIKYWWILRISSFLIELWWIEKS